MLATASGEVAAKKTAIVNVKMLGNLKVKALILENTATVLGLESLCDDHGYDYVKHSRKPLVKNGKKVFCASFNGAPYICQAQALPGASSSSDEISPQEFELADESPGAKPAETQSTEKKPAETQSDGKEVPPPPEPIKTVQSKKVRKPYLEKPPPSHYLTHFPKHPNCEVCNDCKTQRAQHRNKKNKKKNDTNIGVSTTLT